MAVEVHGWLREFVPVCRPISFAELAPRRAETAASLLPGLLVSGGAEGRSPQAPPGDPTAARLEDLMNLEVGSVSNNEQRLSRAATAVLVITDRDIQRPGAINDLEAAEFAKTVIGVPKRD